MPPRHGQRRLSCQLERGRQDRNGQRDLGPTATDHDWLIAFAPVGNTKVAIAVVVPNQAGYRTGAGTQVRSSSRSSVTCLQIRVPRVRQHKPGWAESAIGNTHAGDSTGIDLLLGH